MHAIMIYHLVTETSLLKSYIFSRTDKKNLKIQKTMEQLSKTFVKSICNLCKEWRQRIHLNQLC